MTREIETRICRFLIEAGWGDAQRRPLAGDASARRYERLERGQTRAVLMIAPNMGDEIQRFMRIGHWLTENGFSAPRLLAQADGLLLLEDLGDDLVARLIAQDPAREAGLYREITDFLLALHARPAPAGLSTLDAEALSNLAQLCGDWYLPAAGREAADFAVPSLIAQAYSALDPVAPVMCLRDFHAENLLWLPERSGTARLGVLDFQDAVAAHPAYDLVSALQDARRDVAPELEAEMFDYYVRQTGAGADDPLHHRRIDGRAAVLVHARDEAAGQNGEQQENQRHDGDDRRHHVGKPTREHEKHPPTLRKAERRR